MGTQLPSPKGGGAPPQFSARVYCGQTAGWIKMPLGREIGLSPSDIVLDGDPAPPSPKGTEPKFSSHIYCGQTARWMKMPLGTEGDLSPGQIMLDDDPVPPCERGTTAPALFSAHVYCDHGRPSQLLLSSCTNGRPETLCCAV